MSLSARRLLLSWEALLIAIIIVVVIVGGAFAPHFLTPSNFSDAASNLSEKALMLLPIIALIIAREIDLSVASTAGLASVVVGFTFTAGIPLPLGIALAIAVGALCGLLNGVLVAGLGLPSLVVTLGTLGLYRGLCYVILEGNSVAGFPEWFTDFGFGYVPGTLIPQPAVVVVVAIAIFAVWLHASRGGRTVYAYGNGPGAARFSALPVRSTLMRLFVVSGVMSALAGVVYSARFASARADAAFGFELDVVAAALLGGVSILGGRGSILGGVLGLALLGLVRNALTLLGISSEIQSVVVGALLVAAVSITTAVGVRPHKARREPPATRPEEAPIES